MKKKVLILGCSSFSGASMVNFLLNKKRYYVYGTYRRKKQNLYLPFSKNQNKNLLKTYKIDLLKNPKKLVNLVLKIKPYYIIDFASICMVNQSWSIPHIYFETNVFSKDFLIRTLSKYRFCKKYIYISTPEIFGSQSQSIHEKSKSFNPNTPYAVSKLAFEASLSNYFKSSKFPVIISRFSNFYGPGQPLYRLIPKVIACIDNKIKFPLEGSGATSRNYIYSYDFCNGIYKILLRGKVGKIYHFSGKRNFTTKDVVKKICDFKLSNFNKLVKRTKGRINQDHLYMLKSKKTRKELNWKPLYSLEKGLKEVILYHKNNYKKFSKKDLIYKI